MPRVLTRADLGDLGDVFATGATARLFQVRLEHVPWADRPLLYKEYKPSLLRGRATALRHSLGTLVAVRDGLHPDARKFLDRYSSWPRAIVTRNETATGILIPRAEWRCESSPDRRRDVDSYIRGTTDPGYPPLSAEGRDRFASRFLRYFAFLHTECDLVYGDLSGRNVLVGLRSDDGSNPYPVFVDLDSARKATHRPAMPQGNTTLWETPERRAALAGAKAAHEANDLRRFRSEMASADNATKASDVYKAGLMVLRLYAPEKPGRHKLAKDADALHAVSEAGVGRSATRTLEHALSPVPDERPTMIEFAEGFIGAKIPGWGTQ